MSRAFVKEPDGGQAAEDLPDRPISDHPNFVTAAGLAKIDAEIARLRQDLAKAQTAGEKQTMATASRELRYWTARRSSAEQVDPPEGEEVRFGSKVTIERGDGRRQTWRIVGEDEAEPSEGTLSYVSPLARALTGKAEGDEVEFMEDTLLVVRVGSSSGAP